MKQRQWKPRSRLRRALRRSSFAWWAGALALAVATASLVNNDMRRASRAAADWGTQRRVWVVQRAVPAGAVILAGDATLQLRPRGVVPEGALAGSATPIGAATRVALAPGEVVLSPRVARRGAHGIAALVPPGQRAIAVRNDESMPMVRPGDRVDVIATFDVGDAVDGAGDGATTAPSIAVAANASVLSVTSKTITLAVSSREAPRVAFALARAAVTLSVRG